MGDLSVKEAVSAYAVHASAVLVDSCVLIDVLADDAQWADIESLRTLKRLLTHPNRFCGTLVLVDESGTTRIHDLFQPNPEPMREGHMLNCSPTGSSGSDVSYQLTQIALHPLPLPICQSLLEHWALSLIHISEPTRPY